ncbi:hypothetical protein PILCRDRAFT_824753 [Piloderma croceum F 1598]|uniref:Uncharacterized protein n=1 Tax=Piloderma croceum (strain F 1598) TaxID=765440 RepID=A0A0C3FDQ7_PILCF|nr:hypothetical protein PILCRDRAFT_824753 [Piloderma croceum F 1598]
MDLSTSVSLLNLTVMLAVPSKCVIDIVALSLETVDWDVYFPGKDLKSPMSCLINIELIMLVVSEWIHPLVAINLERVSCVGKVEDAQFRASTLNETVLFRSTGK